MAEESSADFDDHDDDDDDERLGLRTISAMETGASASDAPVKVKKRGGSRFLSFLNCCSASDNTGDIDSPNTRTKPFDKAQHAPGKEPSGHDDSTANSKEEKASGGPRDSDKSTDGLGTTGNNEPLSEKQHIPETVVDPASVSSEPLERVAQDPPLPPIPSSSEPNPTSENTYAQANVVSTEAVVIPKAEDKNEAESSKLREKQTAAPSADTTMTEAPPIARNESEQESLARETPTVPAVAVVPTPLPPPPPRDGSKAGSGVAPPVPAPVPSDKHQWLLPPIQPRFQGKKCLVLDLDETLVHSSFKVGTLMISARAVC